jgi:A/G-specific adenine glycosylase
VEGFMDIQAVVAWFYANKRVFPWGKNPTPYEVLVSEVMLQQTQAMRVIPFFFQWMKQFPSLEKLAHASEQEVIKAWEGLGYYSRARSLQKAAKTIVERFNGEIPCTKEALLTIPGIGPYTAGAILSFAFHKKAAAVDANVVRILARFTEKNRGPRELESIIEDFLPPFEPWVSMEALIELGALICRRTPLCEKCPLAQSCLAKQKDTIDLFPPSKSQQKTFLWRDVAVIITGDKILLCHRTGKGIMSGLFEFPFFESSPSGRSEKNFLHHLKQPDLSIIGSLHPTTHSFTRYRATLYPVLFFSPHEFSWPEGHWILIKDLGTRAFSSGHRKIMRNVLPLLRTAAQTYSSKISTLDQLLQSSILCREIRAALLSGEVVPT